MTRRLVIKLFMQLCAAMGIFYCWNLTVKSGSKDDIIKFTWSDPKSYEGPIVEGWPPNKSRDMHLYIKPEEPIITLMDTSCLQIVKLQIDILILIQSAPEMSARRDANRNTWMLFQSIYTIKTLFIFGTDEAKNRSLLQQEQDRYCDLIQLDYVDHYNNVTLDTVFAMKFALGQKWAIKPPKFIIIGDDDAYINIPELWRKLFGTSNPAITEFGNTLWGCHMANDPELQDITHSNYCPKYMYNNSFYPNYLSGGAYVIPFHLLDCIYRKTLKLPYFHVNDVLVTGFARQQCHIKLNQKLDFDSVLSHRVSDDDKYGIHRNLSKH